MRASCDFDNLVAYRSFIDEIVGRRNARHAKRIDVEDVLERSAPADTKVSATKSKGQARAAHAGTKNAAPTTMPTPKLKSAAPG